MSGEVKGITVFDQIGGLPVHVLVIHAAVVFVPLLAVGAVVYATARRWRAQIGWAVSALAVVAPITAFMATVSGKELYDRLITNGVSGTGKERLDTHLNFGTWTSWLTLALAVVALMMVVLTRRRAGLPRPLEIGFVAGTVVLSVVTGYYVFQTGDSGAQAVWGTY